MTNIPFILPGVHGPHREHARTTIVGKPGKATKISFAPMCGLGETESMLALRPDDTSVDQTGACRVAPLCPGHCGVRRSGGRASRSSSVSLGVDGSRPLFRCSHLSSLTMELGPNSCLRDNKPCAIECKKRSRRAFRKVLMRSLPRLVGQVHLLHCSRARARCTMKSASRTW